MTLPKKKKLLLVLQNTCSRIRSNAQVCQKSTQGDTQGAVPATFEEKQKLCPVQNLKHYPHSKLLLSAKEDVNQQQERTQDLCLLDARPVSTRLISKMSIRHIFRTNISASSSRMDSNSSSMLAAGTCLRVLLTIKSTSVVSSSPKNSVIFFEIHGRIFSWSSCCWSPKFILVSILASKKDPSI